MDLLESLNIRSLPEQQTRLSHHPNVGQMLSMNPNICLGFDACCFCAKRLLFDCSTEQGSFVACSRCKRVKYCSEECKLKDADPNLAPCDVDEKFDVVDPSASRDCSEAHAKKKQQGGGNVKESNKSSDDDEEEEHKDNKSIRGPVDVMMEPGGHSPTVCSLLRLCNIDEEVEEEVTNNAAKGGVDTTVEQVSKKVEGFKSHGGGASKNGSISKSKKQCHHYHNDKKHNRELQKKHEREGAQHRIVSELESYPATLANIMHEGPCFQRIFELCPKKEQLVVHIVGSSSGSEIWPTSDEIIVAQRKNLEDKAVTDGSGKPPSTSSPPRNGETWMGVSKDPSVKPYPVSSLLMPYEQAYTQALGDTLVDSHPFLKVIKLLFVGPDCPRLKKRPKMCKVKRRSTCCGTAMLNGDPEKSIKPPDPDPHGLLLNAGASGGHKRKRGLSFDRTKMGSASTSGAPESPKITYPGGVDAITGAAPSPTPPPPPCHYKVPPKHEPHQECSILIDTCCATYEDMIARQKQHQKMMKKEKNNGCGGSSPKHVDVSSVPVNSSCSSSPANISGVSVCWSASPDIIIMFNPGLTCPDYSWKDTLDNIKPGTPFIVTSNTEMEALAELQYLFDNKYISELPATAADIIQGDLSGNAYGGLDEDTNGSSSDDDDEDNREAVTAGKSGEKKDSHVASSEFMFFGENPYCGLRVRQSGTMANDLYVKNRWMYGGLWGTLLPKNKKRRSSALTDGTISDNENKDNSEDLKLQSTQSLRGAMMDHEEGCTSKKKRGKPKIDNSRSSSKKRKNPALI